jgi:hypothetical protein
MNPPMIGFLAGVVVGGAGAIFLMGLLSLYREPENEKIIQKIENGLDRASIAKSVIREVMVCWRKVLLP